MADEYDYDLFTIGAGSGGVRASRVSAAHGAKVAIAEAKVHDTRDEPSGELKVTAPTALGSMWLAPRLGEFHEAFPNIHVRLMLDDHELDLAGLEAEVLDEPRRNFRSAFGEHRSGNR